MVAVFDEMTGFDGSVRSPYGELSRWLSEVPPEVLDHRRREAELIFRRIGITFAVYGEADAQERLIPFDVVPRILAAAEWDFLQPRPRAAGQGDQRLYQRHLRPARDPASAGVDPGRPGLPESGVPAGDERPEGSARHLRAHRRHRHRARRRRDFYVLEDNARTPSGVSYMLENREIMLRLFPELFSRHRVAPVENYPDELLATLKSVAPTSASSDPTVVLLTPGIYNSAYYEHSFLADKLGVELVEGRDLFVKDDDRLHAHDRRAAARRRDLPPHRRRLPRSARLPPGFGARRAGPHVGLPGRQCHARQRGRHRHRRRQGGLQLHARDREVLSRRRADPEQRADLALPRAGRISPMCSTTSRSWWSRKSTAPAATAC